MTDVGTEAAPSVRPQRRPLRALTILTVVLLALAAVSMAFIITKFFTPRDFVFGWFAHDEPQDFAFVGQPSTMAFATGSAQWVALFGTFLILGFLGFVGLIATLSVRVLDGSTRFRALAALSGVFLGLGTLLAMTTTVLFLLPAPDTVSFADGEVPEAFTIGLDGQLYASFPSSSLALLLLPPTIWLLIIGVVGLIATVTVRRTLARRQTAAAQAETDTASDLISPQRRGSRLLAIATTVLLGLAALLVAGIVAAMVLPTASSSVTLCEEQDSSTGCFAGGPEVLFESGATSPLLPNLHWAFLLLFPAVTFLTLGLLSLIATLTASAARLLGSPQTPPAA